MSIILTVRDLSVRFGAFQALSSVDLDVSTGKIHSVIGPNGAGKTTLFNALTGASFPTGGKVVFDDRDVTVFPESKRAAIGMARSFQITNIFAELTVYENLRLATQAVDGLAAWVFWRSDRSSSTRDERIAQLLAAVRLDHQQAARAGDLSHGQQRRLEIGMALACGPKIVFLDEPLAGMGLDDIKSMKDLIKSLVPERTVVLIEHNMSVVLDISDTITVMALGRKIAEGPPASIRTNQAVKDAYLGSTA